MPETSRLVAPRTPFDGIRAHFQSAELGVYAWFISDPDGWICRYSPGLILTKQIANFVSTDGDAALKAHFPPSSRLLFVQDFSEMVSYEADARKIFTDWGARIAKRTQRTVVVPPPMNAMFRMGLSAATLALRIAGTNLETCPDVQQAIKKYSLRPYLGTR